MEEKNKICIICATQKTPQWRQYDGKIMCNACGLKFSRYNQKYTKCCNEFKVKIKKIKPIKKNKSTENYERICEICGIKETPLWRKIRNDQMIVCNKCGLKYKRDVQKISNIEDIAFNNCTLCHTLYSSYRTQIGKLCMMCKLGY